MDYKKRVKSEEPTTDVVDEAPAAKKARVDEVPQVQQGEAKSSHVFYPNRYKSFDPSKIVFAKDPIKSRDGSGELLYISYLFDDGIKPLMVQTPNAMYSPTGINVWKDGKASLLLSGGRDWEENTLMVEFYALITSIQKRCTEVVAEKGWNTNGSQDPLVIRESFSDLMFIGMKEDGEKYPPSIKAAVVVDGKDPAELFEKVSDSPPTFNCLIPSDVRQGCGVTAIIHIPWVFRKKAPKKGWNFSIRSTLYQARIFPAVGATAIPHSGCAIVDA